MSGEINPYASPQLEQARPLPAVNPYTPGRVRPFAPANGSGNVAMVLILVAMAIEFGVIAFRYVDVQMLASIGSGQAIDQADAIANEQRILLAERLRLVAVVGAAIPFIMWLHRSHRNLPALLATPLNFSPGWTIGAWFIPVANVVVPYLVVQEVHRGSDPLGLGPSLVQRLGPRSLVVMLWWFFWISCGIVTMIGTAMITSQSGPSPDLAMLSTGAWLLLATSLLRIGAGLSIIQVIRAVLQNQSERLALAAQASATPHGAGIHFIS